MPYTRSLDCCVSPESKRDDNVECNEHETFEVVGLTVLENHVDQQD